MSNQLTSNAEALRLFFTDDVYLLKQEVGKIAEPVSTTIEPAKAKPATEVINTPITPVLPPVINALSEEPKQQITFEYLGKNQKGILILVNDSINKVSTPQGTELLRKLVKAIELTNNDFALVNYAHYSQSQFHHFHQFFKFSIALSFGVTPQELGLGAFALHVLHSHQNSRLIFTKNLHDLESDPAGKKLLWGSLQQLK